MIKLQRGEKPNYLSDEKVIELTQKHKDTGHSVWNYEPIKTALLESSFKKCAYCELDLTAPSVYMEVEHFLPKSKHADLVVEWTNLLPACKRCNGTKNDDDILNNPIINPFDTDPKDELIIDKYFVFGKTELGENTESTLELNEEDLYLKRAKVVGSIELSLINLERDFKNIQKLDKYKRNRFKAILKSAQPNRPYSAFVSSAIHSMPIYGQLKERLIDEGFWTPELEEMHNCSLSIKLDRR